MKKSIFDPIILFGGLLVCLVGAIYLLLTLNGLSYKSNLSITPRANLTMIPANQIPTVNSSYLVIEPTPTLPVNLGEGLPFVVGVYVQIINTGGNGLRLRANPGTNAGVNFIAAESEVFKVVGGPVQSGDYQWWQLVAPYDSNRKGWAAGDYLRIITQ